GDYDNAGALTYGVSRHNFVLYLPATTLPTQFQWFAWSKGNDYNGPEAFVHGTNPGFEGFSTVPEPASMSVLALGVLAVLKRRGR
ncbi:MAG: PEP-CTERM sorting domain-containing protein, partial [Fimbriimonas sp.]